jgi:hypothetical protein
MTQTQTITTQTALDAYYATTDAQAHKAALDEIATHDSGFDIFAAANTCEAAIEDLRSNINVPHAHAVLLRDVRGYRVELHAGFCGECCCCDHPDYVWREGPGYTTPAEIRELEVQIAA